MKTSNQLVREAKSHYDKFIAAGEAAIETSAKRIVQMPLFTEYSQGMGSWSFRMLVVSYNGRVLIPDTEPIFDTREIDQIIEAEHRYKDMDHDWREEWPPPFKKDTNDLIKAREAILRHSSLVDDLESFLSGSFLGTPLTLHRSGRIER